MIALMSVENIVSDQNFDGVYRGNFVFFADRGEALLWKVRQPIQQRFNGLRLVEHTLLLSAEHGIPTLLETKADISCDGDGISKARSGWDEKEHLDSAFAMQYRLGNGQQILCDDSA